jgi:hypothetical protein
MLLARAANIFIDKLFSKSIGECHAPRLERTRRRGRKSKHCQVKLNAISSPSSSYPLRPEVIESTLLCMRPQTMRVGDAAFSMLKRSIGKPKH